MIPDQEPPFDTVVFDCDSTLSAVEGIDELAGDHSAEVSELTRRAMDGEVPLDQVYGRRLEMIHPKLADLERVDLILVTHAAFDPDNPNSPI